MQTFAEFMAESFRSDTPLTWNYPNPSSVTATFHADRIKVTVVLEGREPDGPWLVAFEVDQGDSTEVAHSAFEIFNGVFQSFEEFVSVKDLGYELKGPVRVDPFMEFTLRRVKPSGWKPA